MPTILPPPEPQTMGYSVNATLLSALMRQWGQRVDQALADDLRWTDLAAWVRRYPMSPPAWAFPPLPVRVSIVRSGPPPDLIV
jgi:hypothetical protein